MWVMICATPWAQATHRDSVLVQARYLKSIYKTDEAIDHYKDAYRYNPKYISALSTVAYCYEQKKDYRHALEWYEKYLQVAKPGSKGYDFATKSIEYLKGELFMDTAAR